MANKSGFFGRVNVKPGGKGIVGALTKLYG